MFCGFQAVFSIWASLPWFFALKAMGAGKIKVELMVLVVVCLGFFGLFRVFLGFIVCFISVCSTILMSQVGR